MACFINLDIFDLPVTLSNSLHLVVPLFGFYPLRRLERQYHRHRQALFPPPFTSAGLEDEVGATERAAVGASTPFSLFEPLGRVGGFRFGFPLGELGV